MRRGKESFDPAIEKAAKDPESKARLEKLHFIIDYRSLLSRRSWLPKSMRQPSGSPRKSIIQKIIRMR